MDQTTQTRHDQGQLLTKDIKLPKTLPVGDTERPGTPAVDDTQRSETLPDTDDTKLPKTLPVEG